MKRKNRIVNQASLIILLVVFVITSIVMVTTLQRYYGQSKNTSTQQQTLTNSYWKIFSAVQASGKFNLELRSNIGNILKVADVQSYALSNSQNTLATSTGSEIDIYDLPSNTKKSINLKNAISGDFGNVITWSSKDDYIAIASNNNKVSVFNVKELKLETEFTANLVNIAGKPVGVVFNPAGNTLLARTFRPADGVGSELATTYLKVYSLAGDELFATTVREAVTTSDQISFVWDKTGNGILYRVDPIGTKINFANTAGFSLVIIK